MSSGPPAGRQVVALGRARCCSSSPTACPTKKPHPRLGLSALTVKSHLARIARKLGTGDRAHLVALAMRTEIIH